MSDKRNLKFSNQNEKYSKDDSPNFNICFTGINERNEIVRCKISYEALHDYDNDKGKKELEIFRKNRVIIEEKARQKYRNNCLQEDGSVLICWNDLHQPKRT